MEITMNKIIIALGVALVSATAAFADSSALDVKSADVYNAASVDQTATGAIGTAPTLEFRAKLGDGSPMYIQGNVVADSTATGAIGTVDYTIERAHFGDGSPANQS